MDNTNIPAPLMNKILRSVPAAMLLLVLSASVARGFYDEVVSLQNELSIYEKAHASDFSDVLSEMGKISGSVFTDVSDKDWFQPYVTSLAEWNIVSGYRDAKGHQNGTFKPQNRVTVAEALKMAIEAARIDQSLCTGTPIHTAAKGHWAQIYVACGEKLKLRILQNSELELDRPATRGEIIAIVADTFGDKAPGMYSDFKDTTHTPYESDIAYAALRGIVSGDKNADGTSMHTFRPNAKINRAEVSKVIYERLKIQAKQQLAMKNGTPSI